MTAEVAAAASDTNGAPTGRHRARKPGGPAGSGGSGAPGGGIERSLSSRVAAATRWSLLNTVVIRVGNFALGVVLARYFLGPGEWGLYAVGLLVLNVLLSANEMGVSLAVVRWEGDVRRFAPTVLTLSFANSLLLYALLFVSAPAIAAALGSDDAVWMVRVLCLAVVIDGLACVPHGVITREFLQGRRMAIDFTVFVVSGATTLVLAGLGAGAMSFAWGSVAGSVSSLIGSVLAAPGYLRFGWDGEQARKLLRFGLPLAGASVLVLAMLNVDSAVVGAILGPAALGLYQIAFNVSSWPVRSLSEAARRVSFAGFSRIADDPRELAAGFTRALSLLLGAAAPICALLAVLAEPIIEFIYGSQWRGAAAALRFLAILGLLRVAYELSYDCLSASHRRKSLLAVQSFWLVALIPVLIVFARWRGIEGVAQGHVVVGVLVAAGFLLSLASAGIPAGRVVRTSLVPLVGGVACAIAAWCVHQVAGEGFVNLVASTVAGLLAYAPFVPVLLRRIRSSSAAGTPAPGAPGAAGADGPTVPLRRRRDAADPSAADTVVLQRPGFPPRPSVPLVTIEWRRPHATDRGSASTSNHRTPSES